jgi:formylglycine-generating enzyme required for sulfatase activity
MGSAFDQAADMPDGIYCRAFVICDLMLAAVRSAARVMNTDLTEPDTRRSDQKLTVFVSYSRKDLAFADQLVAALETRGFEVLIDRRDLPELVDWERELLGLIRRADTVVFIVSPHSVTSKVVKWEVEQVRAHAKRLAPIVIADIGGIPVPDEIARINYLFFTDEVLFEERVDQLASALNTDITWLKEHTRLSEMVRRWKERSKPKELLVRGRELDEAEAWAARRPREAPSVTEPHREFLAASRAGEGRTRRMRVLVGVLLFGTAAGLAYTAWSNEEFLKVRIVTLLDTFSPKVLTPATERELKPGQSFKECASCPELIVVPAGEFMMGSPANENRIENDESPRHKVTIAKAFAVSKFEVTFDEWDACVALRGCAYEPGDQGWGRARRPVINVSWDDVQQYVKWLSRQTGKHYRLLSEAEWEYSTRAGGDKTYSWGDEIGQGNANCDGCGSQWDKKQTAPVGSFAANAFGLHDMHGNVFEWVQDCYQSNYNGAPTDGSAFETNCTDDRRVLRGGAWGDPARNLRAAFRDWLGTGIRGSGLGFRVARTLTP